MGDVIDQGVVGDEQLEKADAAGVAEVAAAVAALGAVERGESREEFSGLAFRAAGRFVRLLAGGAELAYQALGEDAPTSDSSRCTNRGLPRLPEVAVTKPRSGEQVVPTPTAR